MAGIRGITLIMLFCLSASLRSQVILDSVVIKAKTERVSTTIYTPKKSRMLIPITGENDPVKLIISQSGVSTGVEGSSSIFVRGGNNGNNRIELDGVPFYDSGHLLGLISSFPSGIIDNISFRKGGQSSSKGDFSASLTEIRTKNSPEGSSVTLSPFFASAFNSGYVSKKKNISYIASARYTLLNPLWKTAKKMGYIEDVEFKPISGDLFFRLDIPLSGINKITTGAYYSNDDIFFAESDIDMSIKWGNKAAFVAWKFLPASWLTVEAKGYYLKYTSSQSQVSNREDQLNTLLSINERIEEYALNTTANFHFKNYSLVTGVEMKNRQFFCASNVTRTNTSHKINSIFADLEYNNSFISARAGVRQSGYSMDLTDMHLIVTTYFGKNFGAEITFDKMHQLTHIAEGGLAGWRDFIVPASDSLPQESCSQFYLGGYYTGKKIKV